METPYLSQSDQPLFPKVLWSRPITKSSSGSLLLPGGHSGDFLLIQSIYQYAVAAGIGQCSVILPDSLQKLLQSFSDTYFVASSPSGSIGRSAIAAILHLSNEYDGLAIGANLSNNSETAVVVERIIHEAHRPSVLYADGLEAIGFNPRSATNRADCLLIVTMPELFKLAGKLGVALSIKPERELLGRVELVQQVAAAMKASLVCAGRELIVVSAGQTSVTSDISARINAAIYATLAVFWTQKQSFQYLTTAAYVIRQVSIATSSDDTIDPAKIVRALQSAVRTD